MHSRLERGKETWCPKERETGEREASRPGWSSEQNGLAGPGRSRPSGDCRERSAAALGLGCGTHRPAAHACRSGPRTGALLGNHARDLARRWPQTQAAFIQGWGGCPRGTGKKPSISGGECEMGWRGRGMGRALSPSSASDHLGNSHFKPDLQCPGPSLGAGFPKAKRKL